MQKQDTLNQIGMIHFVKMLHNNGYTGQSDEDVVNKWSNDVCKTVLLQERADLDYGLQEQQEMSLDASKQTLRQGRRRNWRDW